MCERACPLSRRSRQDCHCFIIVANLGSRFRIRFASCIIFGVFAVIIGRAVQKTILNDRWYGRGVPPPPSMFLCLIFVPLFWIVFRIRKYTEGGTLAYQGAPTLRCTVPPGGNWRSLSSQHPSTPPARKSVPSIVAEGVINEGMTRGRGGGRENLGARRVLHVWESFELARKP